MFDGRYALSTVVGFRPDLHAAELLFTSLLAEITQVVLDTVEAETHRSALPVLAARRSEVDDTVDTMFGHTIEHSPLNTRWDGYGAMRGKLAGDHAQLAFADLTQATAS